MTTLTILKARIADELNRTDMTNQIVYAISDAVALYQSRRFRFNQQRSTFTTTAGTEFYTTSVIPNDIAEIDSIVIDVNGRKVTLDPWSYSHMEGLATTTNTQAQPRAWAWYEEQIRLYPVPDATYTLTISYLQKLPVPETSNAWTDEASSLIRHAAKRMVAADVLKDQNSAASYAASEQLELRRLLKDAQRLQTGGLSGSM